MSNPFKGKSTAEIARAIRGQDEGYCNPYKLQMCAEDRADAIEALEDRGYSREEAKRLLDDDDY